MQRVLGNESEQRETTKTKKGTLMNTGPRKKNQRWRNVEGVQDGCGVPKKVSVSVTGVDPITIRQSFDTELVTAAL